MQFFDYPNNDTKNKTMRLLAVYFEGWLSLMCLKEKELRLRLRYMSVQSDWYMKRLL